MAAYLLRKDVERWKHCAKLSKQLGMYSNAIYCYNRAIKQSSKSNPDDFLQLKYEKMEIYKLQNDNSSVARMLTKLLKKFRHSSDPSRHLNLSLTLAQTYSEMSQYQKGLEIIDDLITKHEADLSCILDLIIGACDIYLNSNDPKGLIEFVNRVKLHAIIEKSWEGDFNV